jgi:hypothetical protein
VEDPEDEKEQGKEGGNEEPGGVAEDRGEDFAALAEEERARRDEQAEAHAPKMADDALKAEDTAAKKHAKIADSGEKHHGTHEKTHADAEAAFGRACLNHLDTAKVSKDAEGERDEENNPIEAAGFAVFAFGGEPGGGDEIEGEDAAADVVVLMLERGEIDGAGGHSEHRSDKDFSGKGVARRAFTEDEGGGTGEQADHSGGDVERENGRPVHGGSWRICYPVIRGRWAKSFRGVPGLGCEAGCWDRRGISSPACGRRLRRITKS